VSGIGLSDALNAEFRHSTCTFIWYARGRLRSCAPEGGMGFETIPNTDIHYGLISFDGDGRERLEPTGRISELLIERAKAESVTNVFFFCHGWKGDLPAAREQYERWIKAFATSADYRGQAPERFAGFRPLFIGLHWPSLPFGDEELRGGVFGGGAGANGPEQLLETYLARLGNQPQIRAPLEIIIAEARRNAAPDELPPHIRQSYLALNEALGLKSEGVDAPPDADRAPFDPDDAYDAGNQEGPSFAGGFNLGGILGPLRQLSYWTMKKRARTVGEGGMHLFLKDLQSATAPNGTRTHLMGHSFGTIVVSGMLGGPDARGSLLRPVDSVALIQGAVSLWCYAAKIPFASEGAGYFTRILADRKVKGPIVTTRSKYDDAVGKLYPLASRFGGSPAFAATFPEFGAIGTFGLQGLPDGVASDLAMLPSADAYGFAPGRIYNLEASRYICHRDGVSGAHSDIAGPEVAHAIWAAALASAASADAPGGAARL
jgi:hypothetical protein